MVEPFGEPISLHKSWFWTFFRIAFLIGILISIGGCVYAVWSAERWINYKWNYQGKVVNELDPIKAEIDTLKLRVELLEMKAHEKGLEKSSVPPNPKN